MVETLLYTFLVYLTKSPGAFRLLNQPSFESLSESPSSRVNQRQTWWAASRSVERQTHHTNFRRVWRCTGGEDLFRLQKKAASWEMFLGDSPSWLVFSEFEKNHQGSWTFKQFPSISKLALHCNSVFHTRTLYSLAPACYPTHQGQTDQTTSTDGGFWWSSWSTSISSQCLKYILWFHFIG